VTWYQKLFPKYDTSMVSNISRFYYVSATSYIVLGFEVPGIVLTL